MDVFWSLVVVFSDKTSTKVFLDKLLKLNSEGADFTDEDLKDEVITMAVAVIYNNESTTLVPLRSIIVIDLI